MPNPTTPTEAPAESAPAPAPAPEPQLGNTFEQALEAAFAARKEKPSGTPQSPAEREVAGVVPPPKQAEQTPLVPGKVKPTAEPAEPAEPAPPPSKIPDPTYKPGTKAEQWKALHEKIKQYETELAEAKKKPSADPEVAKERDQYRQLLEQIAAERLPENEQAFDRAMQGALKKAKTAVGPTLASKAEALLSTYTGESEQELAAADALYEQLSPARANALSQALSEAAAARRDWQNRIETSRQNWSRMQAEQAQRVQAELQQRKEQLDYAFSTQLARWQDPEHGLAAFQVREGDKEHNAAVEQSVELAREILTGQLAPEELCRAALWASAAPRVLRSHQTLLKENESLKAEIGRLQSAAPTGGSPMNLEPALERGLETGEGAGDRLVRIMTQQGINLGR